MQPEDVKEIQTHRKLRFVWSDRQQGFNNDSGELFFISSNPEAPISYCLTRVQTVSWAEKMVRVPWEGSNVSNPTIVSKRSESPCD